MKDKITTFYDNTCSYERSDEIRQYLFENPSFDDMWETPDDIPTSRIDEEMSMQDSDDWENFTVAMNKMLSEGHFLLTGVCGRWDGPAKGGKFIENFRDFTSCIAHLDFLKIYEKNGHLYIEGTHHDGRDYYELKKLTKRGYEIADKYYFAHDGFLHNTLMNNNFYSTLPHLARYA